MIKFLSNTRLFLIGVAKIIFVSKFKNLHKHVKTENKEVIILGNGPSLGELVVNAEFLNRLKELDVVGVNSFCDHSCFELIKPAHYVMAAPDYWESNVKDFYIHLRNSIYNNLSKKVSWQMNLFIPWQASKEKFWQEMIGGNKFINIVYFNIIPYEGSTSFKFFCFKNRFGIPRLHNVIGPSIMNMLWLDYKKIYLVGVEHSWLPQISVDENNNALVGQPHFYDKDAKPEKMNGVGGVGYRRLHEIIYKFYLTFKGYFEVEEFAKHKNVEIINLTDGSYIDAFTRQKLDIFIKKSNNN